jgi:hypothetical protein
MENKIGAASHDLERGPVEKALHEIGSKMNPLARTLCGCVESIRVSKAEYGNMLLIDADKGKLTTEELIGRYRSTLDDARAYTILVCTVERRPCKVIVKDETDKI